MSAVSVLVRGFWANCSPTYDLRFSHLCRATSLRLIIMNAAMDTLTIISFVDNLRTTHKNVFVTMSTLVNAILILMK